MVWIARDAKPLVRSCILYPRTWDLLLALLYSRAGGLCSNSNMRLQPLSDEQMERSMDDLSHRSIVTPKRSSAFLTVLWYVPMTNPCTALAPVPYTTILRGSGLT